jgi:hypothetical protein
MFDAANLKRRVSLKIFAGLATACLLALPGAAVSGDYTRHCNARLIVAPQAAGASEVVVSFVGQARVPSYSMVNRAREWAQQFIVECVQAHWASREAPESPSLCRRGQSMYPGFQTFPNYPFMHLSAELTQALCAANPDALLMTADVRLQIRGKRGCVPGGGYGPDAHQDILIADDFHFRCAALRRYGPLLPRPHRRNR